MNAEKGSLAAELVADPHTLEETGYNFTEEQKGRIRLAKELGLQVKLFVLSEGGSTRIMALSVVG